VNPMVALGATDSRFYVDLSPNIYRFAPLTLHQEDLARIHGLNERISIEDYKRAIGFYYQLLINL
jgi:carboxypeptidase PM20D1